MPVRTRSNNAVIPANQRSVDVAKATVAAIMPIQQRRYDNAFQIQGYESLIYNRLKAGIPCSCSAHGKALSGLLDEQGKMPQGEINRLLTGMEFEVKRYAARTPVREDIRELRDPPLPPKTRSDQFEDGLDSEDNIPPGFDIVGTSLDDPFATVTSLKPTEGTNGPVNPETVDDLVGGFDSEFGGFGDSTCTVCFGSGFVGGYSLVNGCRIVLSTQWENLKTNGTIEVNTSPHSFEGKRTDFEDVVLPKGFIGLDAFKIWNNTKLCQGANLYIDDVPFTYGLLYHKFDGQPHIISVRFDDADAAGGEDPQWTHVELQVNLSTQQTKIEFPKLQQSTDITKLDLTEDVSINVSPIVPVLSTYDVVIEMVFGKAFIVGPVSWWNSNARDVLGWDATCRVASPNELFNLLPRRNGKSPQQMVTRFAQDNRSGNRRV